MTGRAKAKAKPGAATSAPLVAVDGRIVRDLIALSGRTVAEVAARAGMTDKKLDAVIHGRNRKVRRPQLVRLARTLGERVAVITGEEPLDYDVIASVLEDLPAPMARARLAGRPWPTRAVLEVHAARKIWREVAPSGLEEAAPASILSLLVWRTFLTTTSDEEWPKEVWPALVEDDERSEFAAALGKAFRILLRPWRERRTSVDPLGPRLLVTCWQAFLACYYANRLPDLEHLRRMREVLDHLDRAYAAAFTAAPQAVRDAIAHEGPPAGPSAGAS